MAAKLPGTHPRTPCGCIGPITASAIVATVGNATDFKNSRQLAAWMGLVPKQCSSGGKQALLGISKRGDTYLKPC